MVTRRFPDGGVSQEVELKDGRRVRERDYYVGGKKYFELVFGATKDSGVSATPTQLISQTRWNPQGGKIAEFWNVTEDGKAIPLTAHRQDYQGVGKPPLTRRSRMTYWDPSGAEVMEGDGGIWRSGGAAYTGTVIPSYHTWYSPALKSAEMEFENGKLVRTVTFDSEGQAKDQPVGGVVSRLYGSGGSGRVVKEVPPGATWMGATVKSLERLELKSRGLFQGVVIDRVEKEGPAARSKLEVGDVVLAVESRPIASPQSFQETLDRFAPGSRVKVEYLRKDRRLSVWVTLDRKP
jgi:hypothetical protein